MTEGTKQKVAGVLIALAFVLGTAGMFGVVYAWQAHSFLEKVLYEDASGARFTRKRVLELVSENGMQQILQNAAKQAQEKAKGGDPVAAQPPAAPVK